MFNFVFQRTIYIVFVWNNIKKIEVPTSKLIYIFNLIVMNQKISEIFPQEAQFLFCENRSYSYNNISTDSKTIIFTNIKSDFHNYTFIISFNFLR